MIMSLTCFKWVHTHPPPHTYTPPSISLNNLLSLAFNIPYFVTPLGGTVINGKVSLLVLSRLLPDC